MFDDEGRCHICDGRHCAGECKGREGHVWVGGYGWAAPSVADALELSGRRVDWTDVWTAERYGVTV